MWPSLRTIGGTSDERCRSERAAPPSPEQRVDGRARVRGRRDAREAASAGRAAEEGEGGDGAWVEVSGGGVGAEGAGVRRGPATSPGSGTSSTSSGSGASSPAAAGAAAPAGDARVTMRARTLPSATSNRTSTAPEGDRYGKRVVPARGKPALRSAGTDSPIAPISAAS